MVLGDVVTLVASRDPAHEYTLVASDATGGVLESLGRPGPARDAIVSWRGREGALREARLVGRVLGRVPFPGRPGPHHFAVRWQAVTAMGSPATLAEGLRVLGIEMSLEGSPRRLAPDTELVFDAATRQVHLLAAGAHQGGRPTLDFGHALQEAELAAEQPTGRVEVTRDAGEMWLKRLQRRRSPTDWGVAVPGGRRGTRRGNTLPGLNLQSAVPSSLSGRRARTPVGLGLNPEDPDDAQLLSDLHKVPRGTPWPPRPPRRRGATPEPSRTSYRATPEPEPLFPGLGRETSQPAQQERGGDKPDDDRASPGRAIQSLLARRNPEFSCQPAPVEARAAAGTLGGVCDSVGQRSCSVLCPNRPALRLDERVELVLSGEPVSDSTLFLVGHVVAITHGDDGQTRYHFTLSPRAVPPEYRRLVQYWARVASQA